MYNVQEPLLGRRESRFRILAILLGIVTILFSVTLGLFIWQLLENQHLKHPDIPTIPPTVRPTPTASPSPTASLPPTASPSPTIGPTPTASPTPGPFSYLTNMIVPQLDTSVDPCTDFYQFACGGYEAKTHLNDKELIRVKVFKDVQENNDDLMAEIINSKYPLVTELYDSCMQSESQNNNDTQRALQEIEWFFISDLVDPTNDTQVFTLLATLHSIGVSAFFDVAVQDNVYQENSLNYLTLSISGTIVGDIVDYDDSALEAIAYLLGVADGETDSPPIDRARLVVALEKQLVVLTGVPPLASHTDIFKYYEVVPIAELTNSSGMNYSIYAEGVAVESADIMLFQYQNFANLTSIIRSHPAAVLQDYLLYRTAYLMYELGAWSIITSESGASIEEMPLTTFMTRNQQKKRSNIPPIIPSKINSVGQTDSECIDVINNNMQDYIGFLFSQKVVDGEVADSVKTVTTMIQQELEKSFDGLEWLDGLSKNNSITKLKNIIQIIGHPNKLEMYQDVHMKNFFVSNLIALQRSYFKYTMQSVGTPYNRSDFDFPANIVNAFYSPNTNTINFPAGILESPMYSVTFPKIFQFARMGYVIGHETTHGFDSSGRFWNEHGVLKGIMDNETGILYNKEAQCIIDQFNSYFLPAPNQNLHVNGQKTLGENIADLGGAKNAYRAYKTWSKANPDATPRDYEVIPNLDNDQLFFVLLGQTWCSKYSPEGYVWQVNHDVHSPSPFRVNGPLSNFDEFSKAFSCAAGTPMNRTTKCVLW